MTDATIAELAARLLAALAARGQSVATAESCTGGWIAKALTDVAGSSQSFGYGWVTYSNDAKSELLGVDAHIIDSEGAVSEPVVAAMARSALELARADYAVAVSGIAGPGGGSDAKPVGTVWLAWAQRSGEGRVTVTTRLVRYAGPRAAVRRQSVVAALEGLLRALGD